MAVRSDNDNEPTIEVSALELLELLEFMGDLGPSPGVTVGGSSGGTRQRKAMGLTLEQLAERAAQDWGFVGTIEKGRLPPVWPKEPVPAGSAPDLFERASPAVQAALMMILRAVSAKRRSPLGKDRRP